MNYKVYVKDGATGLEIQDHAIILGYKWLDGNYYCLPRHISFFENHPFLIFLENEKNEKIIDYMHSDNFESFKKHDAFELTPKEFLKLTPEDVKSIPTHEEIMTKWWYNTDYDYFFKVIGYDASEDYPYKGIEGNFKKEQFKNYVSYDIPPEGNLE